MTVTDPEMQRYFMTTPEAVQLVLQAGALARAGGVYFLDMGQPVRIAQLAEDVIRLSGLRPHVDIDIEYTGARPGEKLFEELATDGEETRPTEASAPRGLVARRGTGRAPQMMAPRRRGSIRKNTVGTRYAVPDLHR